MIGGQQVAAENGALIVQLGGALRGLPYQLIKIWPRETPGDASSQRAEGSPSGGEAFGNNECAVVHGLASFHGAGRFIGRQPGCGIDRVERPFVLGDYRGVEGRVTHPVLSQWADIRLEYSFKPVDRDAE